MTPNVSPVVTWRRAANITMTGMTIAMTAAAAISFQMISNCVTSPATPTGNVWAWGVAVRMKANWNSAQSKAKTMIPAARTPDPAQRQQHVAEGLPATAAVDQCRLLDLERDLPQEAPEHPDRQRQVEDRVDEDQGGQLVVDARACGRS